MATTRIEILQIFMLEEGRLYWITLPTGSIYTFFVIESSPMPCGYMIRGKKTSSEQVVVGSKVQLIGWESADGHVHVSPIRDEQHPTLFVSRAGFRRTYFNPTIVLADDTE